MEYMFGIQFVDSSERMPSSFIRSAT